eukprot:TRINITY_DN6522_c0_g1_i3.p1 TRINITY_DN6522_c0_g1~~TRINITY_DN6522_c0_g1_i3.p1  ORF type:complete len:103 (-),score=19.86 TRINITY_DN6522_c0_g1_i3:12-320(-)
MKQSDTSCSTYCSLDIERIVLYYWALEHEETKIGPVKIFGSPYGHWGSHNDAFMNTSDEIFGAISKDTHIVITHMPPVLPKQKGYRGGYPCEGGSSTTFFLE